MTKRPKKKNNLEILTIQQLYGQINKTVITIKVEGGEAREEVKQ